MNPTFHRIALASLAAAAVAAINLPTSGANGTRAALASDNHAVRFPLVRSAAAVKANCLPNARGVVRVTPGSLNDLMEAGGQDPTQNLTGPAVTDTNAVFRPTHQYHLGLWYNSPDDAAKAGCPATVTPFNGEQHAGIQALSTRTFPDNQGPLSLVHR
jgi:hypothetical protein